MTIFRVVLLERAKESLKAEMAYSSKKWGQAHRRRYQTEIKTFIQNIGLNPYLYRPKAELGQERRVAVFKGHHILFRINEITTEVEILDIIGIHKHLS